MLPSINCPIPSNPSTPPFDLLERNARSIRTFDVLIAPFRTAPIARVERMVDLANILCRIGLSSRSIRRAS